jgi:Lon-like protease
VKRLLTSGRLAFAGLVLLAAAALILWLAPSGQYILLPDKARPVAALVTVNDPHHPAGPDKGEIFFLDVIVRKATLGEDLFPWINSDATLVPASALKPSGVSDQAQHQIDQSEMVRSQDVAAVVALRALGYKVTVRRLGARISDVIPGTPAAGKLEATDVIVAVDGKPVRTPSGLRRQMSKHKVGELVHLTVRSSKGLRMVSLRPIADPHQHGRPVIGVIVDQSAQVNLPFPVKINAGAVVGPSAGLAFALEIAQKLGRNVDRGQKVAATGELELNGTVLPIGGVKQKAIEANHSHVDILLAPAGDNATEARKYAGGVRVLAVNSFQQALHELATVPAKG